MLKKKPNILFIAHPLLCSIVSSNDLKNELVGGLENSPAGNTGKSRFPAQSSSIKKARSSKRQDQRSQFDDILQLEDAHKTGRKSTNGKSADRSTGNKDPTLTSQRSAAYRDGDGPSVEQCYQALAPARSKRKNHPKR